MAACIKWGPPEPVPTCNRQCGRSKRACPYGGFPCKRMALHVTQHQPMPMQVAHGLVPDSEPSI